jgi:hypothetical protein
VKVVRLCAVALCASATFLTGASAAVAKAKPARPQVKPVPSLTPVATEKLWRVLVQRRRQRQHAGTLQAAGTCRPMRAVFYAETDWLRLATKLAQSGSPCAQYYISVPPLAADKTAFRNDQAWRIRALGPNFHVMAEAHVTGWANWVATTGSTWEQAGIEFRRRIAAAGYDVNVGDTWALNELSSAVRRGDGSARTNMRAFARGLYTGDGTTPAVRGTVFITGMAQPTGELSVYQARLQDWYEDAGFWSDMAAYTSDWSQELYGDVRDYAVAGTSAAARRDSLNEYLQHELALARVAPAGGSAARSYLETAYSPLANAAWQYDTGFGWTNVTSALMKDYVSAQTYALASYGAAAPEAHFGFAWGLKNMSGLTTTEFNNQSGEILDRLAAAIRDASQPVDPADPGVGACGPFGQNLWCTATVDGAAFVPGWSSFATWKPSRLAFTTAPQTLIAGDASAPVTVGLRTYSGVALPAGVAVPVTLSSSSPTARFSASATGPWTATLATSIPSTASTVSVYFQETKAGPAAIAAAATGKVSAAQTEDVAAATLSRIAVAPASATVSAGSSRAFSAAGYDAYGNPVAISPAWSVSSGTPGTVAASGLFTAGARSGAGTVIATAGGFTATAAVTVPTTARVTAIGYSSSAVTATLVNGAGAPIPYVQVALNVYRNGVLYAQVAPATGADGIARAAISTNPSGCYTSTVVQVKAPGWDGKTPANRYCK